MAVLMANRGLGVRKRAAGTLDGHGEPVGGSWGTTVGPWPGRVREGADGSWTLAVDTDSWPLAAGDLVVEPDTGRSWLVTSAALLQNNLDSTVDYVRCDGMERVGVNTEAAQAPQPTTHT